MSRQIGYEEAMTTLAVMFDTIDTDIIHAVLSSHNGQMEETIDELLVLQSAHAQRKQGGSSSFSDNNNTMSAGFTTQEEDFPKFVAPELPDDFLTFEDSQTQTQTNRHSRKKSQVEEDEEFAKALQQRLYLEEREQTSYPGLRGHQQRQVISPPSPPSSQLQQQRERQQQQQQQTSNTQQTTEQSSDWGSYFYQQFSTITEATKKMFSGEDETTSRSTVSPAPKRGFAVHKSLPPSSSSDMSESVSTVQHRKVVEKPQTQRDETEGIELDEYAEESFFVNQPGSSRKEKNS